METNNTVKMDIDYAIGYLNKLKNVYLKNAEENPYVKLAWSDEHPASTFVKISNVTGNNDEFLGGEYIAEITIGSGYPLHPPSVKFLTPNGVTSVNRKVCIDRLEPGIYSPMGGIFAVACLLPSLFMQWQEVEYGVGIITKKSADEIKKLALSSVEFNSTNAAMLDINALFVENTR